MEITLGAIINKLWLLLVGWWWYDKKQTDTKFNKLDNRITQLETARSNTDVRTNVLETKLDGIKELLESKFSSLHEDIKDLKSK